MGWDLDQEMDPAMRDHWGRDGTCDECRKSVQPARARRGPFYSQLHLLIQRTFLQRERATVR